MPIEWTQWSQWSHLFLMNHDLMLVAYKVELDLKSCVFVAVTFEHSEGAK